MRRLLRSIIASLAAVSFLTSPDSPLLCLANERLSRSTACVTANGTLLLTSDVALFAILYVSSLRFLPELGDDSVLEQASRLVSAKHIRYRLPVLNVPFSSMLLD